MENDEKKIGTLRVWGIEMPFESPSKETVNAIAMFVVLVSAFKFMK